MKATFVHVNLIARDWKGLARFYRETFGCVPVPPERHLSGKWLDEGTGVENAELKGVHLRLPGYDESGPTLEIFQYSEVIERPLSVADQPGFGHVAFAVEDVEAACNEVLAAGGSMLGKVASAPVPGRGSLTFAYVRDPEGNIIELQNWS